MLRMISVMLAKKPSLSVVIGARWRNSEAKVVVLAECLACIIEDGDGIGGGGVWVVVYDLLSDSGECGVVAVLVCSYVDV